jgi:hypothetical protein
MTAHEALQHPWVNLAYDNGKVGPGEDHEAAALAELVDSPHGVDSTVQRAARVEVFLDIWIPGSAQLHQQLPDSQPEVTDDGPRSSSAPMGQPGSIMKPPPSRSLLIARTVSIARCSVRRALKFFLTNFNARRTLHRAIDTVRAINKLREGGGFMMDGVLSC